MVSLDQNVIKLMWFPILYKCKYIYLEILADEENLKSCPLFHHHLLHFSHPIYTLYNFAHLFVHPSLCSFFLVEYTVKIRHLIDMIYCPVKSAI